MPASTTRTTRLLEADAAGIAEAARILAAGGLVALPTETVYGLACDATEPRAVADLYAAKGRPSFNPLIAHVPDLEAARRVGVLTPAAEALAARFWPGPLTLVVPALEGATCDLARAGLASVALRVPAHPVAQAVLKAAGRPIAAPSANRSGHVSPTTAAHVLADLKGRIDLILDAGPCAVGVESTILDCTGTVPVLLRPGGLPREVIEAALGASLADPDARSTGGPGLEPVPLAPGMLASHYAPSAPVRLEAAEVRPGEALLTFAGAQPPGFEHAADVRDLSPTGDLVEAAARLFAFLRELDAGGAVAIAVVPLPRHDLGEAIADRLRRAAAPRPI
ncbi:threonylcarbamoyl-AMP synthase [Ancylobacter dichloromethanicus]|uniref:Threonylcarbamoyl-AMP synthase n=1 Tax=Ancylobacter dichloromethanicus TaxID=518825 RepID=A0A9W6JBS9_9HYPH|nr:L-threonylcarbamoyladenylate synthase [Ancylobacter dichloromethanicus]MBS7553436.1 threonylcarbamoyl-AMP synthase [Ancylobacter dichloromethanicus]GLK74357.1 threonylcarbamoyl-AMP synthase [Ancylobacter dichloromethanicus]